MGTVTINAPKTPVTQGSNGVAAATVPNVCKMPGPPAPFVPTPLPNIGRSGLRPTGYSLKVKIEGKSVAIRGATFGSQGDIAAKASGGGVVSANVEGPTKFVGPGSMDVMIEGKNVQLLGDPMLNNCGPSGSPPNSATMLGVLQASGLFVMVEETKDCPLCHKKHEPLSESELSKADASSLDAAFTLATAPITVDGKRRRVKQSTNTMLGVVHGKCGLKYAGQSGTVFVELCTAAEASGMKHFGVKSPSYFEKTETVNKSRFASDSEESVITGMKVLLGDSDALKEVVKEASDAARSSLKAGDNAAFASYPPGSCAAQKTLLLARQNGCIPAALTEAWHGKNAMVGKIRFTNALGQTETNRFEPGQSVPPCGTCSELLPLLLCPGDEPSVCSHGRPGAPPRVEQSRLPPIKQAEPSTLPSKPEASTKPGGTSPSTAGARPTPPTTGAPKSEAGVSAPVRGGGGSFSGGGASGNW